MPIWITLVVIVLADRYWLLTPSTWAFRIWSNLLLTLSSWATLNSYGCVRITDRYILLTLPPGPYWIRLVLFVLPLAKLN